MTASLFYEQRYDWTMQPISELFEVHRPKEVKRAKRFINDMLKLSITEQDRVYEFLILTPCKQQDTEAKEGKPPVWLLKIFKRWRRYNDLERDLVEQLIGV